MGILKGTSFYSIRYGFYTSYTLIFINETNCILTGFSKVKELPVLAVNKVLVVYKPSIEYILFDRVVAKRMNLIVLVDVSVIVTLKFEKL